MATDDLTYRTSPRPAGSQRAAQAEHDAILEEAEILFAQQLEWSDFYRKVLGVRGVARRTLRTPEALAAFERSDQYQEILRMLTLLRAKGAHDERSPEPTKVITVRLPKSLHETLRVEAFERRTSMNKLCISKLLQYIDNEYVPEEL